MTCTDQFAYSDIYDCLFRAKEIIKDHKQDLIDFFDRTVDDPPLSPSGTIINPSGYINPNMWFLSR